MNGGKLKLHSQPSPVSALQAWATFSGRPGMALIPTASEATINKAAVRGTLRRSFREVGKFWTARRTFYLF